MKDKNKPFTYEDFLDFRYFIDKEYYYYTCASVDTNRVEESYKYYKAVKKAIANFEKEAITEYLKKTGVNKDFFTSSAG